MNVLKIINQNLVEEMIRAFLLILEEIRRKRFLHERKMELPEKLRQIFKERMRYGFQNIARISKRL